MLVLDPEIKRTQITKIIRNQEVPALGFSASGLEGRSCSDAVTLALETGFRHLSTSHADRNEQDVGWGMRRSSVDRDDLFLADEVKHEEADPSVLVDEIEKRLIEFQTEYLDLALIERPQETFPIERSIEALHSLQDEGKIRNYGVSDFSPSLFQKAVEHGDVFCNQVEYHPLRIQGQLLSLARESDAALSAQVPAHVDCTPGNPGLEEIARERGKSVAQVALRWLIQQRNVLAISLGPNGEAIESNFEIFDFELDDYEMERIAGLS